MNVFQSDGSVKDEIVLTGSKVIEETVVNAASVAAVGGSVGFDLLPTTEDEIWVLISIDKTTWNLLGSTYQYSGSDGGADMFYPRRNGVSTTHSSVSPCTSLFLGGINLATVWGLTPPTTMSDAKNYKIVPYKSNAKARVINNHATDIATVTVKLLRVWKKGE